MLSVFSACSPEIPVTAQHRIYLFLKRKKNPNSQHVKKFALLNFVFLQFESAGSVALLKVFINY